MDTNSYQIEEYKHIATAIIDIDKRILQVFGVTTAVAVSLLSAVIGIALGKEKSQFTVMLAYATLAPNILIIPSFYLLLSQRIDIIRFGSYRQVFFEELNQAQGWEVRLQKFRSLERTESNDPIPYTFWAIFLMSAFLFVYGIIIVNAPLCHLFVLIVPIVFIARCHNKWGHVVSVTLPRYLEIWRNISSSTQKP